MGEFGSKIHDRDFMVDYFKRHNAEVVATVPKDRLLVFEATQGWAPLCEFLGVPVPDTPYPRVNSREEFGARIASSDGPPSPEKMRALIEEERHRQ
jgi:hypothetical protein